MRNARHFGFREKCTKSNYPEIFSRSEFSRRKPICLLMSSVALLEFGIGLVFTFPLSGWISVSEAGDSENEHPRFRNCLQTCFSDFLYRFRQFPCISVRVPCKIPRRQTYGFRILSEDDSVEGLAILRTWMHSTDDEIGTLGSDWERFFLTRCHVDSLVIRKCEAFCWNCQHGGICTLACFTMETDWEFCGYTQIYSEILSQAGLFRQHRLLQTQPSSYD